MFNRRTLFIIGAGAGVDVGLPIGRELAKDIAKRTRLVLDSFGRIKEGSGDDDLANSFFDRSDISRREYLKAFNLIQNGILLANSIDDFLNIHEHSPEVVNVGKSATARAILHAERHSLLYIDPENGNNKLNLERIQGSWFVKFMQVLGPGRKVPDVDRVLDDVSFIVFNYDRCLEHFLIHALQLLYGITRQQALEIVGRASIIHPYGSVGSLDAVGFGGLDRLHPDYFAMSKGIKTYNEQVEEETTLDNIHQAINRAAAIVFLGFAYHKQNMELLFRSLKKSKTTRHIFGTARGMSDADQSEVEDQLVGLFPQLDDDEEVESGPWRSLPDPRLSLPLTDHVHIENKLGCSELFDYYAKSLAG